MISSKRFGTFLHTTITIFVPLPFRCVKELTSHLGKLNRQSSMEQHLLERSSLIDQDLSFRRDRNKPNTAPELSADRALRNIRAIEADSVWLANESAFYGDDTSPCIFPGMQFLTGMFRIQSYRNYSNRNRTAKGLIMKTELFKILVKVFYIAMIRLCSSN